MYRHLVRERPIQIVTINLKITVSYLYITLVSEIKDKIKIFKYKIHITQNKNLTTNSLKT